MKSRLANDVKGKTGERQFNGLVDVFVKTLKSDGIQGLYRGFTISVVGIFIYRGIYFGLYDTLKPLVLGKNVGVSGVLVISFLLGWATTVTADLMFYPIGEFSYFYRWYFFRIMLKVLFVRYSHVYDICHKHSL